MADTFIWWVGAVTISGIAMIVFSFGADAIWRQLKAGAYFADLLMENRRLKSELARTRATKPNRDGV